MLYSNRRENDEDAGTVARTPSGSILTAPVSLPYRKRNKHQTLQQSEETKHDLNAFFML